MALATTSMCLHAQDETAPVIYVKKGDVALPDGSSWRTAFGNLQDALLLAEAMVEVPQVWVAEGTYKTDEQGQDPKQSFVISHGVRILGGFAGTEESLGERDVSAHPVILSGDLLGNDDGSTVSMLDNAEHVVDIQDALDVQLDGITIEGGCSSGGGVHSEGSDVQLVACTIRGNRSFSSDDGGAGMLAVDSTLSLDACSFLMNTSPVGDGAALRLVASIACIDSCGFALNAGSGGYGGAVSIDEASAVQVASCVFSENTQSQNSGGAVAVFRAVASPTVEIRRSWFLNNTAGASGGGVACIGTRISDPADQLPIAIDSCEFIGNRSIAAVGGGLSVSEFSRAVVRNATFVANKSSFVGGAVFVGDASILAATSCILWGNVAPFVFPDIDQIWSPSAACTLQFSCVQGMSASGLAQMGSGNTSVDPHFIDQLGADGAPATGDEDFRLAAGSPCVDAGVPDECYGVDLGGVPRWLDGDLDGQMQVDMGAYEFSNVDLSLTVAEGNIKLHVGGNESLVCLLLIGRQPGEKLILPFGELLLDPTFGIHRIVLGRLPIDLSIDESFAAGLLGESLPTIQALGVLSDAPVGNFSGAVGIPKLSDRKRSPYQAGLAHDRRR